MEIRAPEVFRAPEVYGCHVTASGNCSNGGGATGAHVVKITSVPSDHERALESAKSRKSHGVT